MADFTLPELGENVTSGDVLRVLVKPGDTITKDQTVLELETDKATIEVPSSVAGRVTAVTVKAGDKVKVGQVVLSVEDGAQRQERWRGQGRGRDAGRRAGRREAGRREARKTGSRQKRSGKTRSRKRRNRPRTSRGRRPSTPTRPRCRKAARSARRRAEAHGSKRQVGPEGKGRPASVARVGGAGRRDADRAGALLRRRDRGEQGRRHQPRARARAPSRPPPETPPAPAAPSVRRMARELGVEIEGVAGSGADGRISIEDVKAHAKRLIEGAPRAARRPRGRPDLSLISRAGATSSGSRCVRCGGRPPST